MMKKVALFAFRHNNVPILSLTLALFYEMHHWRPPAGRWITGRCLCHKHPALPQSLQKSRSDSDKWTDYTVTLG